MGASLLDQSCSRAPFVRCPLRQGGRLPTRPGSSTARARRGPLQRRRGTDDAMAFLIAGLRPGNVAYVDPAFPAAARRPAPLVAARPGMVIRCKCKGFRLKPEGAARALHQDGAAADHDGVDDAVGTRLQGGGAPAHVGGDRLRVGARLAELPRIRAQQGGDVVWFHESQMQSAPRRQPAGRESCDAISMRSFTAAVKRADLASDDSTIVVGFVRTLPRSDRDLGRQAGARCRETRRVGHGLDLRYGGNRAAAKSAEAGRSTPRFRTIQDCPKDVAPAQMQAERAVEFLRVASRK